MVWMDKCLFCFILLNVHYILTMYCILAVKFRVFKITISSAWENKLWNPRKKSYFMCDVLYVRRGAIHVGIWHLKWTERIKTFKMV
jgi:hypothetical protein